MECAKLSGEELTNYVRATFNNDKWLNDWGMAIASYTPDDFNLGRKIAKCHIELVRRVTKMFPWLESDPWEFDDSVRIVIREYENKFE